jgi:N-acyl homoserine lactone hydrolase
MFEIHSLLLGELLVPSGGSILRDPIHCWYVTNGERHILVDSGMADAADVKRSSNIDGEGGGHASLRKCLAAVGTAPEAIDTIILTHLHFDHAANLDLFPQARVLVQRDEVFHAIDPVPTQRIFYSRQMLMALLARKRPSGLQLLDGDVDLMDGIRLLKVPGHTPGMQVPIVTTARGTVALVSDLGDHYRYWFPADPRATDTPKRYLADTFMPSPICSEGERVFIAGMARIKANADIVVPAHDSRIPKHIPAEWFEIPESTAGDIGHTPPAATQ